MFIPARFSRVPEGAGHGPGTGGRGGKHSALWACHHTACWLTGETDVKSLCKSLINTDWIVPLPQLQNHRLLSTATE